MFTKVLVANRGAIACRIIRTLRHMDIAAVAIYSEADADSTHVAMADEAVCVGSAAVAGSYLAMQRIIEAALATGAQAIHPGYGFLSENAQFVEACEAAGLAFIGPTPEQMRLFGLKHTARALALEAGVPLLPGTGLLADLDSALAQAQTIGYPVMLKSSAGGGGIGMQMCPDAAALSAAFESVKRLAQANFSDAGVFLERYIADARHIEVQIFGDGAGGVLALGERDCSLQRRNQKVVEETPAPNLRDEVRQALLDTACKLAAKAHYRSAGTVEFVLDAAERPPASRARCHRGGHRYRPGGMDDSACSARYVCANSYKNRSKRPCHPGPLVCRRPGQKLPAVHRFVDRGALSQRPAGRHLD
ncbi:MAG: hypothetical protein FD135_1315 [Comamonadaceae bacterium]|nr:MAG: hypothetical protein FD135_1315 [Comamonadaceae bacterium]